MPSYDLSLEQCPQGAADEPGIRAHGPQDINRGIKHPRLQFEAERPNQKWIADFTYIWTAEGWPYVSAVIDLFSRRVAGFTSLARAPCCGRSR